jgi:thiol-disulfide isomerase/thioredoxin
MLRKSSWLLQCFAISVLLFTYSCNRGKQFTVKGQLENSKPGFIYLAEMNLTETKIIDSAEINNKGQFRFKCNIDNPGFYELIMDQNNFVVLLAEPGQKIKLRADANNLSNSYNIEGSKGSLEVKILTDRLSLTIKTIDSIEFVINNNVGKNGFDTLYKRLNEQYIQTIKNQRNFSIKYIIDHLHSMSSIIALYQQLNDSTYVLNQNRDLQFVNIVSDTLKKYFPNSRPVKILWDDRLRLNKLYNRLRLDIIKNQIKELSYPEVTLPDVNGDTIYLSRVKGKTILINFWKPNDENCVLVMRGLEELYKIYKSKGFEIYNIALMEDRLEWKKYVESIKLPGINVIDQKAADSYFATIYNVKSLPASFLIGPDKQIAAKDIFGENLRKKLKEILN